MTGQRIRNWLGWGVILMLLAPVAHTIWVSFSPDTLLTPPTTRWSVRWYWAFWSDLRWVRSAGQSLWVACLSALVSVVVAASAAYGLRSLKMGEQRLLRVMLLLPALLPGAAWGFGLLPLVYATGLWGTTSGLILVHATLGLPVAFLMVRLYLTERLQELEFAAAGLGATRWQIARRITWPLWRPMLLAAGIAVFVLSLNESLLNIFLATPTNETLPAVIWPQLRYAPSPLVAVASCATAVIGMTGVIVALKMVGPVRSQ